MTALAVTCVVAWLVACTARTEATVAPVTAPMVAQPAIGLPIRQPTLIGSSPQESPGETWGFTDAGRDFQIVRYTLAGGWQLQPGPVDRKGRPIEDFTPALGPLAGATTLAGGVAIVGEDASQVQQLLVRSPQLSTVFEEAPTLLAEPMEGGKAAGTRREGEATKEGNGRDAYALLKPGETLFAPFGEGVLMAPVEQDGRTAVFLVPFEPAGQPQDSVLFYDGSGWVREPICLGVAAQTQEMCRAPAASFKVLGIGASSSANAWLLAQTGVSDEGIALFSREMLGGESRWVQRSLGPAGSLGAGFAQADHSFEDLATHEKVDVGVAADTSGQPLTVTDDGVWVDGRLTIANQSEPSDFTLYFDIADSNVTASWCGTPGALPSLCSNPLESSLPNGPYRSFAWSGGGPYGQRVITGLPDSVTLELAGSSFRRVLGDGGEAGTGAGAAFPSSQEGWLADARQTPLTHLTTKPTPDQLQSWPVSFRHPLTAIATQPGATPGELGAQAIAVGDHGQVTRYLPGKGWVPEALLSSSGTAETPDLRGVAWPEPGRAYAVGTHGAMWLWQSATGLWGPDPARPPNLFLANFTGIAFDPFEPSRGYAIGQQGVLLRYGKTWAQEPTCSAGVTQPCLPPEVAGADFLSVAFAGNEALVAYQIPKFANGNESYTGGVLVNDGSGWQIETNAQEALGAEAIPERIAGLPDGGAAIASGGGLILRQRREAPWQPDPARPPSGRPVALALFREGSALRAEVSVDTRNDGPGDSGIDEALRESTPEGQAPIVTAPYPLPGSGFLLRETPNGWEDEEHDDYPNPNVSKSLIPNQSNFDWPIQPDAVLALALAPDGSQGWAVGGQTGEANNLGLGSDQEHAEQIQTAGVMRYPASGAPPSGFSLSPEQTGAANATFAVGGDAQCATACADLAEDQIGPDQWLTNAILRAGQTPGVRAFLYTGSHIAPGLGAVHHGEGFEGEAFRREAESYAELMQGPTGSPPTFAAPSESDVGPGGTLASFSGAFQAFGAPQGAAPPAPDITPDSSTSADAAYYSFDSTGAAGRVRAIVLDYSAPSLSSMQQCWLAEQLAQAKALSAPAIVIGSRDVNTAPDASNPAADSARVTPILVDGTPPAGEECEMSFKQAGLTPGSASAPAGASAYFFDSPQQNLTHPIAVGPASIPAFGSGTLGYISPPSQAETEFLGASGFLLAEVQTAARNPASNRAPVSVKLIPDVSELALDATNGLLLRRSHASLFDALARRPHAGLFCDYGAALCNFQPDPYVPIPDPCQGPGCAAGIFPEYSFTSSNPDIGDFVEPDPASPDGTTVLQSANGKPIPDVHSGLFCAYNAGTTIVTVHAGGLSSSQTVTVQGGSVKQPCGTTPLLHPPAPERLAGLPVPLSGPAPAALTPQSMLPPPPPAPPAIVHHGHPHMTTPPALPVVPAATGITELRPAILPPPASTAQPTPPSGTSSAQVYQSAVAPERQREEQEAVDMVHNMAAIGGQSNERPVPYYLPAVILLLAVAGAGLYDARGRRSAPRLARNIS